MLKVLKNASLLLLVNATAHANVDCGALLAGVEGTARTAQNNMLVAEARGENADLTANISRLSSQVDVLKEHCAGSIDAQSSANDESRSSKGLKDFLPDFGAPRDENAPKRPNAAQRSHGRF